MPIRSAQQTCEVKIDGAWRPVSPAEAHGRHRSAPKRCPACHGAVMTTSTYVQPIQVRLSHRKRHDGCTLMPAFFRGTVRPHPEALA